MILRGMAVLSVVRSLRERQSNSRSELTLILVVMLSACTWCRADNPTISRGPVAPAVAPIPKPVSSNSRQPSGAEVLDVVFFDDSRPVFLRFHVFVHGRPFREKWLDHLRGLFDEVDTNGDGAWTRDETTTSKTRLLEETGFLTETASLKRRTNLRDADLAPPDGKITLTELADFLSRHTGPPVQIEAASDSGALLSPPVTAVNNNVGRALFDRLDADRNGALSRLELQSAPRSLQQDDFDEDRLISLNELLASQNPFGYQERQNRDAMETPFFCLSPERSATNMIRQLSSRYAAPPNTRDSTASMRLNRETLGLQEQQFEPFDADQDKLLDDVELRRFLKHPVPSAELTIRLGDKDPSEPPVAVHSTSHHPSVTVREAQTDLVGISVGDVQIEIGTRTYDMEMLGRYVHERFRRADPDNNEYLDENEAERDPLFGRNFVEFDGDGNGKLFEPEVQKAMSELLKSAQSRVRIDVTERGRDLFQILDGDRDQALSPREFLFAAERLGLWDGNGDGILTIREIPHLYRLTFGHGLPDLPGLEPSGIDNNTPGEGSTSSVAHSSVAAPRWFLKMDVNGDGDLSSNEFLGTIDEFHRLDHNDDGLIDPAEAAHGSAE